MSRLESERAQQMYDVARRFVDQGLASDGSLFTPERAIWSEEMAEELHHSFVENGIAGSRSFMSKLKEQLLQASDEAVQLMAEVIYVHFLIARDVIGGDRKREVIELVLEQMEEKVEIPAELAAALDKGIANPGTAFNTFRAFMLQFLVEFLCRWKRLKEQRQQELLEYPWAFRKLVFDIETKKSKTQRHALLHLVHPDTFEAITSSAMKHKIVDRLNRYVSDRDVDIDRQLQEVRAGLTEDRGKPFSAFWDDDVRPLWEETSPQPEESTEPDDSPVLDGPASYNVDDAMENLFINRRKFESILELLERRKNLILQGPPGVGKTFMCRRLAYALMGEEDDSRVGMVQFHQAYTYEDFIQGYRPRDEGGFEKKNGRFFDFCKKAMDDESQPYVFIIDEINRGNLSKIFGELMMLIEPDKRGPKWSIPLQYASTGDPSFYVPKNVHLIGMMNTADRSLAMVDYALRRRFGFVDLEPQFNDRFEEFLAHHGVSDALIDRIRRRMKALNQAIASDTVNLGKGFCIGHSYFCPAGGGPYDEKWYQRVIDYEVGPLLEEYWFDDGGKAQSQKQSLLAGV